jgi:RHS repeat-associated protein
LLSDGTYRYEYDAEGNRTRRVDLRSGEVTEYSWNYYNQLTDVVTRNSSGEVTRAIEYSYDAWGRRIGKVIDFDGAGSGVAQRESYVYEGDDVAIVFDGNGTQLNRYLHGPAVDQILSDETSTSVNWALVDNMGSVRDIIDSEGQVLNHITYDSFGQVTSELNGSVDFRFGYTGRERDEETGLYYYRARYYDAAVGEFLGEDPMSFWADDYNLSRYTFNSPTNFVDPSGMVLFLAPAVPVVVGGGLTAGQAVVGGGLLVGAGYFLSKGVKDAANWLTRPQPMPDTDPQTEANRERLERSWKKPPSSNRQPDPGQNPLRKPEPFPLPHKDPNRCKEKEKCKEKEENKHKGTTVFFGQKRADPTFSKKGDFHKAPIGKVADQLKNCEISPDSIEIKAFRYQGKLVSENNRSLAALSMARLRPTNIKMIVPKPKIRARLYEDPLPGYPRLPSPILPITPHKDDPTVLYDIRIPGY